MTSSMIGLAGLTQEEKRAKLAELLRDKANQAPTSVPLSPGQKALWLLQQLTPDSAAYNLMFAARIQGGINLEALHHSFQALVDRHPSLRSRFHTENGVPRRITDLKQSIRFEVEDAEGWDDARLELRLCEDADRPFDLERGPLLRVKVFTQSGREDVLLLSAHHIAVDFWSLDLLLDELRLEYESQVEGRSRTLPAATATFDDYVRWQTEWISSPEGEAQWEYWRNQLTAELPRLDLPTDRPHPPVQTYAGAAYEFRIDEKLAGDLRELAKTERTTLYTIFLSAFQVLLSKYAGQDEVRVGSPMAGRTRSEFESVVGYFVNPVVLRATLAGNPTFSKFLGRMRQTVHDAITHQDYPFPLLVERLSPTRDSSRSPLFQASFVWDKPRRGKPSSNGTGGNSGDLSLEPIAVGQRGAPFDLMLTVFEFPESLSASLQYNSDLFNRSTIERMAGHFLVLLDGIAGDPGRRISELDLLTETEQSLILYEWNNTDQGYSSDLCVHQLIEEVAAKNPDSSAIRSGNEEVSYSELNKRANQLALHLQKLGVGPEVLVGVCVERSPEMVVALLAVLKAGAAYVPLDPEFPEERLRFMLEDTQAAVIVTEGKLLGRLPETSARIICLDKQQKILSGELNQNPESGVNPNNLAYVIYTSGSTGTPKGVMIEHRSLQNYLSWCTNEYRVSEGTGAIVHSPIGFDLAVTSIFSPLLAGRCLDLLPETKDAGALGKALSVGGGYSFVKATPAHLSLLAKTVPPGEAEGRTNALVVGGEALYYEDLAFWLDYAPGTRIINEYGPTETVVGSCVYEVPTDAPRSGVVPIGRPIANTQIYLLDEHLQPVPIGVTGEMYIGGHGVARGYLNQPELTKEKFIPDPFSQNRDARLYRTGDLARYRPDGNIEFLGRCDDQVKIQGFRIELGEIESHLAGFPGLGEAVVIDREDVPGDRRLVAYVVPQKGSDLSTPELRSFLKGKLPHYMVPAAFVVMETLPLTANGKIDRRKLPEPDGGRSAMEGKLVPPRTVEEEILAGIWKEVLHVDAVSVHDNFFDLGGASIQSLETASRASDRGVLITPEMIFQHQTIAELAEAAVKKAGSDIGLVRMNEVDTGTLSVPVEQPVTIPKTATGQSSETSLLRGNTLIESLGVYLPSKSLSTDEVLASCRNELTFPLERFTGIKNRRVAGKSEFSIDLARKAVEDCLAKSSYQPADIGLLVCCNISRHDGPKQFSFEPSSAIRIKAALGFENALTFDINNACAGMFTGILLVEAFLKTGAIRCGMVVSGEHISHLAETAQKEIEGFMDPRLACLTVGDAGAALILEHTENKTVGFHNLDLVTLGKYSDLCIAKATSGEHGGAIMVTDSIKQTAVAVTQSVKQSLSVLKKSGWDSEAIAHVIMHQTSETALRDAARAINDTYGKNLCDDNNTIYNLAERGNTASTSHFVAVKDNIENHRIKTGDKVVFGITGSGQTVGTGLYTFDDLPDRIRRLQGNGKSPARSARPAWDRPRQFRSAVPVRIAALGTVPSEEPFQRDAIRLARLAAENCLIEANCMREDIDLILHTGVYRNDFLCEPAIASILAGELEINHDGTSPGGKTTFAFDLLNGSLGFLNACYVAVRMIESGKRNHVLITASEIENNAEVMPNDLRGLVETGSAALLERAADDDIGFGHLVFKDATKNLGSFATHSDHADGQTFLQINNNEDVTKYVLDTIPGAVTELLELEELEPSEITAVFPPQISPQFIAQLKEELPFSNECWVDISEEGKDYFTSSLVYSMKRAYNQRMVNHGDIGIIIGAAAGVQVGCATYRF